MLKYQMLCVTGAVQVGYINGDVVINPSRTDMRNSLLNLIVSASEHNKVGESDGSSSNNLVCHLLTSVELFCYSFEYDAIKLNFQTVDPSVVFTDNYKQTISFYVYNERRIQLITIMQN